MKIKVEKLLIVVWKIFNELDIWSIYIYSTKFKKFREPEGWSGKYWIYLQFHLLIGRLCGFHFLMEGFSRCHRLFWDKCEPSTCFCHRLRPNNGNHQRNQLPQFLRITPWSFQHRHHQGSSPWELCNNPSLSRLS